MKLVIGLGNPGEKYAYVRHNLGFMVLDKLIDNWEDNKKLKSYLVKSDQTIFAKPQTYMNNSGMAVKAIADYYKIKPEDIVIIHDELDLPLGKMKIKKGGGAAGHHGVESVMEVLKTDQFIRIRLGIGPAFGVVEKFVLDDFTPSEKPKVKHMIKEALKAIDREIVSL